MSGSIITLTLRLEIAVRKDDDQWLAWCLPLDVLSQADSKKKAIAALKEAVQLWFESCIQRGVLDAALRELSFKRGKPGEKIPGTANIISVHARKITPASDFTPEYINITVPAAYIAAQQLQNIAAL